MCVPSSPILVCALGEQGRRITAIPVCAFGEQGRSTALTHSNYFQARSFACPRNGTHTLPLRPYPLDGPSKLATDPLRDKADWPLTARFDEHRPYKCSLQARSFACPRNGTHKAPHCDLRGLHGFVAAVVCGDGETHCSKFRLDEVRTERVAEPSSSGAMPCDLAGARESMRVIPSRF